MVTTPCICPGIPPFVSYNTVAVHMHGCPVGRHGAKRIGQIDIRHLLALQGLQGRASLE